MSLPTTSPIETLPESPPRRSPNAFGRIIRYTLAKGVMLFITLAVGLYLTILVVNLGGFIDKVFAANIEESIGAMIQGGWLRDVPEPERSEQIEQTRWAMQEAAGLHSPFLLRSLRWLYNSLRLDLGTTWTPFYYTSQDGPISVVVLQRIPYTLLVTGLGNFLVFFGSIFTALYLARNHGSRLDRLSIVLAPLTSAPSWIMGMLLIFIFAGWLRVLPFPKVFGAEPPEYSLKFLSIFLKHLILPVAAVVVAAFFQGVYSWRSFFLIYANEDYVEIARAKGLPPEMIERRYILRPVLPYIITSLATTTLLLWQGSIALETLFFWPGVGTLFIAAVRANNTALILGVVVIFAYLLAFTVFLLEILYAIVDPRVRLNSESLSVRALARKGKQPPPAAWSERRVEVATPATLPEPAEPAPATAPGGQVGLPSLATPRRASSLRRFLENLRELASYPTALFGLFVILVLAALGAYAVIRYPYSEAVKLWRGYATEQTDTAWYRNPAYAAPAWTNLFRKNKLPENIILDSTAPGVEKTRRQASEKMTEITIPFYIDYPYDDFPQDLVVHFKSTFQEKPPLVTLTWLTPDGRKLDLGGVTVNKTESYYVTRQERLKNRFKEKFVVEALFKDPQVAEPTALSGDYQLIVQGFVFDPEADIEAEAILYGKVFGLAGTDNQRRDLTLGLLWGIPVALAFGVLGAIGPSLAAMLIAAVGVWLGGWVDDLIQRLTEVNMILPSLPIVIMVYLLYSKSIWAILGVVVLISIFGSAIKNYRAAFLQVKSAPYIEAAQAYGVGNWNIIRHYLVPFIMPLLIPQMVIMVPGFVFYEATLGFLGVIDPYLPTWGKLIFEAITKGNLELYPYWFLEPVALLMLTAVAFAMLGIGLERLLYPKLRRN